MYLKSLWRILFFILVVALSLLPVLRLFSFLTHQGADIPSNDEYVFVALVDRILQGNYSWGGFFRDTVYGAHAQPLVALFYIFSGKFLNWSENFLLMVGIGMGLLKLGLAFDLLSYRRHGLAKWWLLPVLSFLVFSPSQLSAYGWGLSTIQYGLNQVGFLIGLWGMQRFPGKRASLICIGLGIIMGAWSYANGLAFAAIYILGLLLLSDRRKLDYFFVVLFGALAAIPYVLYLNLEKAGGAGNAGNFFAASAPKLKIFLEGLGLLFPLEPGMVGSFWPGAYGCLLFVLFLSLLFFSRKALERSIWVPSLLLMAYSLATWAQISLFRGNLALIYSEISLPFWIGVVGMAACLLQNSPRSPVNRGLGLAVLASLLFLFARSNLEMIDKARYIQARSPAAAECLRNYREAPTYCERTLFQWYLGDYRRLVEMAQILEKHRWSVFSDREKWSLQGSYILARTRSFNGDGVPPVFWSLNGSSDRVPFSDFRNLDLFLHAPNRVEWSLSLPPDLEWAFFDSAVALSASLPKDAQSDGVTAQLWLVEEGLAPQLLFAKTLTSQDREWSPVRVSLRPYIGKKIKLILQSEPNGGLGHDWLTFRHPLIALERGEWAPPTGQVSPENVDWAESDSRPSRIRRAIDLQDPVAVKAHELKPLGGQDYEVMATLPHWEIELADPPSLNDNERLLFSLKAPVEIFPRTACIDLRTEASGGYQHYIQVPLLGDEASHRYSYDLKLLEVPKGTKIYGIKFAPLCNVAIPSPKRVTVGDFGIQSF